MTNELNSQVLKLVYSEKNQDITGYDLTDQNNLPTFFTQNKRSLKKGWEELKNVFTQSMTMYEAMKVLDQFKLKTHSYCRMD